MAEIRRDYLLVSPQEAFQQAITYPQVMRWFDLVLSAWYRTEREGEKKGLRIDVQRVEKVKTHAHTWMEAKRLYLTSAVKQAAAESGKRVKACLAMHQ